MGIFDFSFGFSKGGTSVEDSAALMNLQSHLWKKNTQWLNENGWKQMRKGLIDADYNPILAIGSSPSSGSMPTATAESNVSANADWHGAAASQANTAKQVSESQIMLNKATANKTAEEAITQQNIRQNYDADSVLKMLQSKEIQRLLPYKERKMIAETVALYSTFNLNNATAQYVPYNAESGRISANAAKQNAETNATWTPAKIAAGGLAGLIGALGIGKLGKIKPFMKNAKTVKKSLGKNSYRSSSAEYFTTLH